MVDIESIVERLQTLEDYTDNLKELRKLTLADVKKDIKNRWF